MKVDPTIFKAYDIRGIFPAQINADVAGLIGRAFADFLPEGRVAVGRDMRLDSEELAKAFINGLVQQGRQVIDIGLVTTDMAAFAAGFYDLAGAAMITASHNPGKYNGIKLTGPAGQPVADDSGEQTIRDAVIKGEFGAAANPGDVRVKSIYADWIVHALEFIDVLSWPKYQIGVDAANGMMGKVWPIMDQQIPVETSPLFFELDGNFPNHEPNPAIMTNLADLVELVKSKQLDLGIAFDGDGDRAFFVDETGRPATGSETAAILAQRILELHPGATILYDVRESRVVPDLIEQMGGKAVRTPVGGGFIKPIMREKGAVLATEGAGHYYYQGNFCSDSGLITALLIIDIMTRSRKKLSELVMPLRKYASTGEISIEVQDPKATLERVAKIYHDGKDDRLDGLSVDMGDWWFNLRPSNTEPLIRLNLEANSQAIMEQHQGEVLKLIKTS